MDRDEVLTDMLRGWEPPANDEVRKSLLLALEAFSDGQLKQMQKAGVRFWTIGQLPDMALAVEAGPTRYFPQQRIIHLSENVSVNDVRHEMAHTWDHVRTLKKKELHRLDDLNERQLEAAMKARVHMVSDSSQVRRMWHKYQRRMDNLGLHREDGFDLDAASGYSRTSPQEFYAEGYAVFHSHQTSNQARLFLLAPELFEYLDKESKAEGLPIPDRSELEKQIKENRF